MRNFTANLIEFIMHFSLLLEKIRTAIQNYPQKLKVIGMSYWFSGIIIYINCLKYLSPL